LKNYLKDIEKFKSIIEVAIGVISNDNLEIGCEYVEKVSTERAISEIDEILKEEYEIRRTKKKEFLSSKWNDFLQMNLPEDLVAINGISPQQMQIFEDFNKIKTKKDKNADNDLIIFQENFMNIEKISKKKITGQENLIIQYLSNIQNIIKKPQAFETITPYLKYITFLLIESNYQPLLLDSCSVILRYAIESNVKFSDMISEWWLENSNRCNNNSILFIRYKLIKTSIFDTEITKLMKSNVIHAVEFSLFLIKTCIIDEEFITLIDIPNIFEFISKNYNYIQQIFPVVSQIMSDLQNKLKQNEKESQYIKLKNISQQQFNEWCIVNNKELKDQNKEDEYRKNFFIHFSKLSVIKRKEDFEVFCETAIEISIEDFIINISNVKQKVSKEVLFKKIDLLSDLLTIIFVKSELKTRGSLIFGFLASIIKVISQDVVTTTFTQRPYFRLISNLLIDFNTFSESKESQFQILILFCQAFKELNPSKFPTFSFAWLELISHRMFMPQLLMNKSQKGQEEFHSLLIYLFKFLEPYMRNSEFTEPLRLLYKGTLKILLVLLHDFSEFLCNYHFSLCDVTPSTCIQMRNLILSAFPRHMRLPDPFTPNLKVDILPEINEAPILKSKYSNSIEKNSEFKEKLDIYLTSKNRKSSFLKEIKQNITLSQQDQIQMGTKYNVQFLNSLILYSGIKVLNNQNTTLKPQFNNNPSMEIYQYLTLELDSEGRYLLLNALANQLRYPNSHTFYFSCAILYLFSEVKLNNDEIIQEQITRVLLERLIVNRPHPWGLLITFIELVRNTNYNFWNYDFIHCAPEIEKLFENVGKSTSISNISQNE
jgi:CCR4-NOT transcription complex subunit 1